MQVKALIPQSMLILALFAGLLQCTSSDDDPESDIKLVYVDGIFDIAHFGHADYFAQARLKGMEFFELPRESVKIIVGVATDEDLITKYKRLPVYTVAQKIKQLRSFANVYEVVAAPMVVTKEFMEEQDIDLVATTSEYQDPERYNKYYAYPASIGRLVFVERKEDISTTAIMKKVVESVSYTILVHSEPDEIDENREIVESYTRLMEEKF